MKLYGLAELAAKVGFSRQTLLRWTKEGLIKRYKHPGRQIRVTEEEAKRVFPDAFVK